MTPTPTLTPTPYRTQTDVLTTAHPGWLAIHPARTGETRSKRGFPLPAEITTQCGHGPFGKTQARACGLRYWFTGRPCPRGHVDVRSFSVGCVSCHLERKRDPEWQKKHRERCRENMRRHRALKRLEDAGIEW